MADDLDARVHRNLMEFNARSSAQVERRGGELLFASRSSMPFLNGVMREGPDGDPHALLRRAREFFFALGRGFVVLTWPGDPDLTRAAEDAGMFSVEERYPEMVCRRRLAELPVEIQPVTDLGTAAEYWAVCDAAYPSLGFPAGLFAATFTPEELLEHDRIGACLARNGDEASACALVSVIDGVGMVGWVASIPSARGRGHAAACAVWATNRAFELGADVASLQASTMGESLYRRLGYEHLFSYRVLGASSPDATA